MTRPYRNLPRGHADLTSSSLPLTTALHCLVIEAGDLEVRLEEAAGKGGALGDTEQLVVLEMV